MERFTNLRVILCAQSLSQFSVKMEQIGTNWNRMDLELSSVSYLGKLVQSPLKSLNNYQNIATTSNLYFLSAKRHCFVEENGILQNTKLRSGMATNQARSKHVCCLLLSWWVQQFSTNFSQTKALIAPKHVILATIHVNLDGVQSRGVIMVYIGRESKLKWCPV